LEIVNLGIVFFEIGVFELSFVKCRGFVIYYRYQFVVSIPSTTYRIIKFSWRKMAHCAR